MAEQRSGGGRKRSILARFFFLVCIMILGPILLTLLVFYRTIPDRMEEQAQGNADFYMGQVASSVESSMDLARDVAYSAMADNDLRQAMLDPASYLAVDGRDALLRVVGGVAGTSRFLRSSMLEVLRQDYILTARAKGLPEHTVIFRHALRNALLPVITLLGLSVPGLIGGSVIIETIFALPGLGQLFYTAVMARDYPLIMGNLVLGATLTLLGNLLAVKEDDGLVIDTVENQDTALVSAWSWGGEAALVDPPAVGDPFAVEAVELDVRVLDQPSAQQVVVDAAGHLGRNTGGDPAHGEAGLHALTKQRRPGPEACYGPVG